MVAEIEKLADIINGRPVCFIGHGPSLKDLDRWINRFKSKDICWVSLNQVEMPRQILKKIGEDLDIILGYAKGYENAFANETTYVHRYSLGRGNSLSEFIFQLNEIGCELYLFGCDGYMEEGSSYYNGKGDASQNLRHKNDTVELNRTFDGWIGIKVWNVTEKSNYCFEYIDFTDFFHRMGMERSISILLPTRDRPLLLCHMLLGLELNTKWKENLEVLIAYDEDDLLTPQLVSGIKTTIKLKAVKCVRRRNLHSYYNELFAISSNKYVMCINDDTEFLTKDWDDITIRQMRRFGYGWIEDGLQRRECDTKYCCFPIVSREFHDVIGYIQDERWFCGGADINLFWMYEPLGLITYIKGVEMGHLSYHNGTREMDDTNKRILTYFQDLQFDKYPPSKDMDKIKEFLEKHKEKPLY